MELSKKQEEIVNSNENKIVVISAAASGKTAVVSERARVMLERGIAPERMVIITFTVAAANEMSQRIGSFKGLFIGTIHAYAYSLLCASGYHEQAARYVNDEKFDKLFTLVKKHPECVKPVDYLIVDEAQDCSDKEWEFFNLLNPNGFLYVGDTRQCIYEWNGARPDLLENVASAPGVKVYNLNENYRNGYNILNFAKGIITRTKSHMYDDSIPMRSTVPGQVEWVEYNLRQIVDILRNSKEPFKNWFILTRTNDQIESVKYILDSYRIPNITFKRGGKSFNELEELINSDAVKILTIHTAKGLEANNVIVIGVNMWKDEEIRLAYVAATRARNNLYWVYQKKRKNIESWE